MPRSQTKNTESFSSELKDFFRLRPCTDSLLKDSLFLMFLCALHYSILPSIFGGHLFIDILTPWLVVTMIAAPTGKGLFLTALGAFLMETRTSVPAGMYLTCFWMIASGIYLSRMSLSWRHVFPWFFTLIFAQFWMIGTEVFVNMIMLENWSFTLAEGLIIISRLFFSVGLGMLLCNRFRSCELPLETT